MKAKRHSAEQIVAKLREAERLQAQGLTIAPALQAARDLRPQTFFRWHIRYGR